MLFFKELNESIDTIIEEVDGKKKYKIKGRFAVSEEINKNGRIYPKHVLENAVDTYIKEKVDNKSAYGELGHPIGPKINESLISHLITDLTWDRNYVLGEAVIFDTVNGLNAKAIMDGGGRLGVSTRGIGSIKKNSRGINEVQNDLRFSTIADIVTDPSGPGCFVNGIMENREYFYNVDDDSYSEATEELVKKVHTLSKRKLEENYYNLYKNFINHLKN